MTHDTNILLFFLFAILGLVIGYIVFRWTRDFIFNLFLPYLEKKIYLAYKKLVIKSSIRGIYIGLIVGPPCIILIGIASLIFDRGFFDHDGGYYYWSLKNWLVEQSLPDSIFWPLIILISILFFGLMLLFALFYLTLLGRAAGLVLGFFTNFVVGLVMSIFDRLRNANPRLDLKVELPSQVSRIIWGFIGGILLWRTLISGVIGAVAGLAFALVEQTQTWVIFHLTKKATPILILHYKKIFFILISVLICAGSLDKDYNIMMWELLTESLMYIPACLMLLHFNRLRSTRLFRLFERSGNEIMYAFFSKRNGRPGSKRLPKNLLLLIFAGFLAFVLSCFIRETYFILVVPVSVGMTVLVIQVVPKVWILPVYGILIEIVPESGWHWIDIGFFWMHILLWTLLSCMIIHLLNVGKNNLNTRDIRAILKWLEDEKIEPDSRRLDNLLARLLTKMKP